MSVDPEDLLHTLEDLWQKEQITLAHYGKVGVTVVYDYLFKEGGSEQAAAALLALIPIEYFVKHMIEDLSLDETFKATASKLITKMLMAGVVDWSIGPVGEA